MAKKKKKKGGHVAIPFLLSLLLGILCLGGVAIYLFNRIGLNDENVIEMKASVTKPTEADNMTLLFILDEDSDSCPQTFLVARILPLEKKMLLFSFPSNMLAVVEGRQDTLAGFYKQSGAQAAEAAIENESGIQTDRYVILHSEGFQKICNIFAGVYYLVPTRTNGFEDSSEPQYLGPGQMEKLMTYPMFEQGEAQRSAVTADMICEMINQTDHERIVASMDADFKRLINMMETDISSVDYEEKKDAIKYMYNYGNEIASFRIVTGSLGEEGDVFLLNDGFYSSVADYFRSGTDAE